MGYNRKIVTKQDVATHKLYLHGIEFPAINVKITRFIDAGKIAEKLDIDERMAGQLLDSELEWQTEIFWNNTAPEIAEQVFGKDVVVYSAGRSNGWLVLGGLVDIEDWDAVLLAKWKRFVKAILAEMDFILTVDYFAEEISYHLTPLEVK